MIDLTWTQAAIIITPFMIMVIAISWPKPEPNYTVTLSLWRDGIDRKPKRQKKIEGVSRRDLLKTLKDEGVIFKFDKMAVNGSFPRHRLDSDWANSITHRRTITYKMEPRTKRPEYFEGIFLGKMNFSYCTITPCRGKKT